jgi:hypothetical protein
MQPGDRWGAEAEAVKNGWNVVIAIIEDGPTSSTSSEWTSPISAASR